MSRAILAEFHLLLSPLELVTNGDGLRQSHYLCGGACRRLIAMEMRLWSYNDIQCLGSAIRSKLLSRKTLSEEISLISLILLISTGQLSIRSSCETFAEYEEIVITAR